MFTHMDYIYEVYQERSFSKAAQKLFISQSSLSLTIKRAEEKIQEYLWVQYYREHEAAPDGGAD